MSGDCIETPHGDKDKDGYPRAKYQGRLEAVSRTVMGLLYGRGAIEGKTVCHTCNNRACVNPTHLYIGRWRPDVKIEDLYYMYNDLGMSQDAISKQVGISQSSISGRLKGYNP